MILVVGASGFLGRETVRQLLAAGQRVRAAARIPDTVADLRQLGAEIVHADLIDPASLASACNGIDAVFAAAHSLHGCWQICVASGGRRRPPRADRRSDTLA